MFNLETFGYYSMSLKSVGDLQARLVARSCLEFAPGMVKAFLHSRPGYVPGCHV